jgi:hypothetical protein
MRCRVVLLVQVKRDNEESNGRAGQCRKFAPIFIQSRQDTVGFTGPGTQDKNRKLFNLRSASATLNRCEIKSEIKI